jgi:hypothetical protein
MNNEPNLLAGNVTTVLCRALVPFWDTLRNCVLVNFLTQTDRSDFKF